MNRWYYIKKGQTKGPITSEDIKRKIELGDLGPMDLVSLRGSEEWQSLVKYDEFSSTFKDLPSPDGTDQWVVLAEDSTAPKKRFVQKGPYTGDVIRRKIQKGDIKYSDYIWKEGMKEWYKISLVEAFQRKVDFPSVPTQTSPLSASDTATEEIKSEDLLNNVVLQTTSDLELGRDIELMPEEVQGEDLTRPDAFEKIKEQEIKERVQKIVNSVKKSPTVNHSKSQAAKVAGRSKRTKKTEPVTKEGNVGKKKKVYLGKRGKKRRKRKKDKTSVFRPSMVHLLFIGGPIAIVVMLIGISSYLDIDLGIDKINKVASPIFTKNQTEKKKNDSLSKKKVSDSSKRAKQKADKVSKDQKTSVAKKAPTYLKIMSYVKSRTPSLQFMTDASHHYPIKVTIIASAGQVLKNNSVYKVLWMYPGKINKVNLRNHGLGDGYYKVTAEVDDKKRQLKFFLGQNGRAFKTKLNLHRKKMSHWHQLEKHSLIGASEQFYRLCQLLSKGMAEKKNKSNWKKFYGSWKNDFNKMNRGELRKISIKNSSKYVHSKEWLKLKDLRTRLSEESKTVNTNIRKNKPIESEPVKQLEAKALILKNQAQNLSLFR